MWPSWLRRRAGLRLRSRRRSAGRPAAIAVASGEHLAAGALGDRAVGGVHDDLDRASWRCRRSASWASSRTATDSEPSACQPAPESWASTLGAKAPEADDRPAATRRWSGGRGRVTATPSRPSGPGRWPRSGSVDGRVGRGGGGRGGEGRRASWRELSCAGGRATVGDGSGVRARQRLGRGVDRDARAQAGEGRPRGGGCRCGRPAGRRARPPTAAGRGEDEPTRPQSGAAPVPARTARATALVRVMTTSEVPAA